MDRKPPDQGNNVPDEVTDYVHRRVHKFVCGMHELDIYSTEGRLIQPSRPVFDIGEWEGVHRVNTNTRAYIIDKFSLPDMESVPPKGDHPVDIMTRQEIHDLARNVQAHIVDSASTSSSHTKGGGKRSRDEYEWQPKGKGWSGTTTFGKSGRGRGSDTGKGQEETYSDDFQQRGRSTQKGYYEDTKGHKGKGRSPYADPILVETNTARKKWVELDRSKSAPPPKARPQPAATPAPPQAAATPAPKPAATPARPTSDPTETADKGRQPRPTTVEPPTRRTQSDSSRGAWD